MQMHLFISGTGTEVGKTYVTRGLAHAMRAHNKRVYAIKPMETGVSDGQALDAQALAKSCDQPWLARLDAFYRAPSPVCPYAAQRMNEADPVQTSLLVNTCKRLASEAEVTLCEGAGGLLVPVNREHDMAHFAAQLGWPVVLVANDSLGVLSHTLCAAEVARARGLRLFAVVLNQYQTSDASRSFNQTILAERLDCPVLRFSCAQNDDTDLAKQAERSGLVKLCLEQFTKPL